LEDVENFNSSKKKKKNLNFSAEALERAQAEVRARQEAVEAEERREREERRRMVADVEARRQAEREQAEAERARVQRERAEAEAERRRLEEETRAAAEAERLRKEQLEAEQRKAEADRIAREEAERERTVREAERQRQAEEEARRAAEEDRRRVAEEAQRRASEDERRAADEELQRARLAPCPAPVDAVAVSICNSSRDNKSNSNSSRISNSNSSRIGAAALTGDLTNTAARFRAFAACLVDTLDRPGDVVDGVEVFGSGEMDDDDVQADGDATTNGGGGGVVLDEAMIELHCPTTAPADVASLDLALENIGEIADLWRVPNLTSLSLNSNVIRSVAGLGGLAKLASLSLRDNKLQSLNLKAGQPPTTLPALRMINLSQNALESLVGLRKLAPGLRDLSVSSNRLTSLPAGVIGQLADLRRLSAYRNNLTAQRVAAALSTKACPPRLSTLDLGRNPLGASITLPRIMHLSTLVLYHTGLQTFPVLGAAPLLTHLFLNGNEITAVPRLAGVPRLRFLNIASNAVAQVDPRAFAGTPLLSHLDLSFNALGAAPGKDAAASLRNLRTALAGARSLAILRVADNPAGQDVARIAPAWVAEIDDVPVARAGGFGVSDGGRGEVWFFVVFVFFCFFLPVPHISFFFLLE
jgi:Leucine-rich repeat (LRR) protein